MIDTFPFLLYMLSSLLFFGVVCFGLGYVKGADIRYIEIVRERKNK